jgi:hypothetical protein
MSDLVSFRDYLKNKIGDDVQAIGKDALPTPNGIGFLTFASGKLTHVLDDGFVLRSVDPKGLSAEAFVAYGTYSQLVFPSAIRSLM